MKYQIDQSGKVENTAKNTILALSNDVQFAVILKAKAKRDLQEIFRDSNEPEVFIYFVFAALLAILINCAKPKKKIYIDHEYLGHEDIIKLKLTQIWQKTKLPAEIEFCFLGKESPAHYLATKVVNGKFKSGKIGTKIITKEEILKLIYPKENDRVSHSGPRSA